jgi:ABC-type phosphate/phosphonate transport system ATPase subunit
VSDDHAVIELLGIGVDKNGTWRLRRVCARFESRTFAAVLSNRRDERLTLLDVIAGREIPSEGRAWIGGIPLGADTAPRIRQRVGLVDFATSLALDRTAAWNVSGLDQRSRLGRWLDLSWLTAPRTEVTALERVGLAAAAHTRASTLDAWSRIRLTVARALGSRLDHLVVPEPDAHLGPDDVQRLIELLRGLVRRDGLSVFVSFGDPDLARADAVLHVTQSEAALV